MIKRFSFNLNGAALNAAENILMGKIQDSVDLDTFSGESRSMDEEIVDDWKHLD
jgi:hypothetical protein